VQNPRVIICFEITCAQTSSSILRRPRACPKPILSSHPFYRLTGCGQHTRTGACGYLSCWGPVRWVSGRNDAARTRTRAHNYAGHRAGAPPSPLYRTV